VGLSWKTGGKLEPLYGPSWNTKCQTPSPRGVVQRLEALDDARRTRTVPNREGTIAGFPL
jgi:hypothetical protein